MNRLEKVPSDVPGRTYWTMENTAPPPPPSPYPTAASADSAACLLRQPVAGRSRASQASSARSRACSWRAGQARRTGGRCGSSFAARLGTPSSAAPSAGSDANTRCHSHTRAQAPGGQCWRRCLYLPAAGTVSFGRRDAVAVSAVSTGPWVHTAHRLAARIRQLPYLSAGNGRRGCQPANLPATWLRSCVATQKLQPAPFRSLDLRHSVAHAPPEPLDPPSQCLNVRTRLLILALQSNSFGRPFSVCGAHGGSYARSLSRPQLSNPPPFPTPSPRLPHEGLRGVLRSCASRKLHVPGGR